MTISRPLLVLVGEANPYGGDPEDALYHLPRGASGDRLREILGLSDAAYAALPKANLCGVTWDLGRARVRAASLLLEYDALVLLGARVRQAFRGPQPFSSIRVVFASGREKLLVGLPHPSGRCLAWNRPESRPRARDLLRPLVPEIPS